MLAWWHVDPHSLPLVLVRMSDGRARALEACAGVRLYLRPDLKCHVLSRTVDGWWVRRLDGVRFWVPR